MKTDEGIGRPIKRKASVLITLVAFTFIILLASFAVPGFITFLLMRADIVTAPTRANFPFLLLSLLVVSLIIGTVFTSVAGRWYLRPLRILIDATKEISAGNFDVRVDVTRTRELSGLAESMNDMAKGLAGIETLRSDFVSNISHEFKTPVVSIQGFAKRLKNNHLSEERRGEYLDIIIYESGRLARLSSNVLLLSKLESDEKQAGQTPFYLDEQIRRAIILLEPQLQKKELEADIDIDSVRITANEEMLNHLWINLLGNAIKFSHTGGTVYVSLKRIGDNAVVSVADTGVGMDAETKKYIFDKFYQGDFSRYSEGNGLGLSLVKRILELVDGTVEVESEPEMGTRFTLTLPLCG